MVPVTSFPSLAEGRKVLFPHTLANLAIALKKLWTGRWGESHMKSQ